MTKQGRMEVAVPGAEAAVQEATAERAAKNQRAVDLLDRWLDEDGAYDAEVWPLMEQELTELRTRIGD